MSKAVSKLSFIALGGLLLTVNPAWADTVCEQTLTSEFKVGGSKTVKEVVHQKIFIKDKKVRIEEAETGKITLIRFDTENLYHLDPKASTYDEASFQTLRILQGQEAIKSEQAAPQRAVGMDAARSQLKKLTEGLPPERRAFMEQMMMRQQQNMQATPTAVVSDAVLKKTDEVKTINQLPATRYKVVCDNKKIMDVWVADSGPKNYFTQIIDALQLFNPDVLKAVKDIEGFPLRQQYRVQTGPAAGVLQTVEVLKLEDTAVADELFELPANYKKTEREKEKEKIEAPVEEEESF